MSNSRQSYNEDQQVLSTTWRSIVQPDVHEQTHFNTNIGVINYSQSLDCDSIHLHNVWNTSSIFSQFPVEFNINEQENEGYKLSTSLKSIWNDVSEASKPTTSHGNFIPPKPVQMDDVYALPRSDYSNDLTQARTGVRKSFSSKLDTKLDNATPLANNLNVPFKGRPITARNEYKCSNAVRTCEVGTMNQSCASSTSGSVSFHDEVVTDEAFTQFCKFVKLLVQHGFLYPEILDEPICPDVYDLSKMLLFYIQEYFYDNDKKKSDPAIQDTNLIQETTYSAIQKISLIENEIKSVQSRYLNQNRVQQEIYQSFLTREHLKSKTSNRPMSPHQFDVSVASK